MRALVLYPLILYLSFLGCEGVTLSDQIDKEHFELFEKKYSLLSTLSKINPEQLREYTGRDVEAVDVTKQNRGQNLGFLDEFVGNNKWKDIYFGSYKHLSDTLDKLGLSNLRQQIEDYMQGKVVNNNYYSEGDP